MGNSMEFMIWMHERMFTYLSSISQVSHFKNRNTDICAFYTRICQRNISNEGLWVERLKLGSTSLFLTAGIRDFDLIKVLLSLLNVSQRRWGDEQTGSWDEKKISFLQNKRYFYWRASELSAMTRLHFCHNWKRIPVTLLHLYFVVSDSITSLRDHMTRGEGSFFSCSLELVVMCLIRGLWLHIFISLSCESKKQFVLHI